MLFCRRLIADAHVQADCALLVLQLHHLYGTHVFSPKAVWVIHPALLRPDCRCSRRRDSDAIRRMSGAYHLQAWQEAYSGNRQSFPLDGDMPGLP